MDDAEAVHEEDFHWQAHGKDGYAKSGKRIFTEDSRETKKRAGAGPFVPFRLRSLRFPSVKCLLQNRREEAGGFGTGFDEEWAVVVLAAHFDGIGQVTFEHGGGLGGELPAFDGEGDFKVQAEGTVVEICRAHRREMIVHHEAFLMEESPV